MVVRRRRGGRDLAAEAVRTYVVRSAGSCLGMSLVSSRLWQGLHRLTQTRGLEFRPGRSEGRSRESSLSCRRRLPGVAEAAVEPTESILKGPFQFDESFVFRTVASMPFLTP